MSKAKAKNGMGPQISMGQSCLGLCQCIFHKPYWIKAEVPWKSAQEDFVVWTDNYFQSDKQIVIEKNWAGHPKCNHQNQRGRPQTCLEENHASNYI
jgi:hypothetical protein